MTTPIQQNHRSKKRTPGQIADMMKSGDWINHSSVGGARRYPSYSDKRNDRIPMGGEIWGFDGNPYPSAK